MAIHTQVTVPDLIEHLTKSIATLNELAFQLAENGVEVHYEILEHRTSSMQDFDVPRVIAHAKKVLL